MSGRAGQLDVAHPSRVVDSPEPYELYWDHCATTPTSSRVVEAMSASLRDHFANPSSGHRWGGAARDTVEEARINLATLLGASPRDLAWTSGATESNNLAIFGVAASAQEPIHIISQVTEHSAVLEPLAELRRRGHQVTLLPVNSEGHISLTELRRALRPQTRLVSIMHANNEIGALSPIHEIGALLRAEAPDECLFHVDAAQTVGKTPISLSSLPVDLLSLSAHKLYGPKGIGAIYIRNYTRRREALRPAVKIPPLLFGGHQERGVRPGTTATHQIVGLGVAALEAQEYLRSGGEAKLRARVERLYEGLAQLDPDISRRSPIRSAPHVLSVTLSAPLLERVEACWGHIAFSRGSACQSSSSAPSHVLLALGLTSEEASRTVRFGLGRDITDLEIDTALKLLSSS